MIIFSEEHHPKAQLDSISFTDYYYSRKAENTFSWNVINLSTKGGGDMNRTGLFMKILIYLFNPEDTTVSNTAWGRFPSDLASTSIPWPGILKTVFWFVVAVICPLIVFHS